MNEIEKSIIGRINNWKKSLLDMTKRNRLLWYKPYRAGSLKLSCDIFDDEVNDVLELINDLAFNNGIIEFSVAKKNTVLEIIDDRNSSSQGMKKIEDDNRNEIIEERTKILLNLNKKIKLENEEKGLNIGYIAVGFLKWYEQKDFDCEIKSPLIMIPIKIEQNGRHEPIKISLNNDEEITINPVIKKKIESDFNVELVMNVHNTEEETTITKLLDNIKQQIKEHNSWEIINESIIDTFSFQNLAIWNDLDKNREMVINNPFSKVLAGAELKNEKFFFEEGTPDLDSISQENNTNIYEVDSSQQEAIYRARNGESFVIQGPPGTGKSQTITNIIAESLYHGKKVLFVSEKQAALDVVYHKLEKKGLSDFCLILHNSKQRKANVREQIEKSLQLSDEKLHVVESELRTYKDFDETKNKLNLYNQELHESFDNDTTPFFLLGELNKLWNIPDLVFSLPNDFNWNANYHTEISDVLMHVNNYGTSFIDNTKHFDNNYWKYYTNEFNNSTKREVQESIGEINKDILERKIKIIFDYLDTNKNDEAMNDIKDYLKILDNIPFKHASHLELSNIIACINDNNSKQKNIEIKNKELYNAVKDYESIILVNFSQDFLKFDKADDNYKRLINKYNSFFKRLSNDYKLVIKNLNNFSLKKMKYKDYIKNLEILVQINKNKEIICKNNKEIETIKKKTIKEFDDIKVLLINKNNEVEELLYQLNFESFQEYQNYYNAKKLLLDNYKLIDFVNKIENESKVFDAKQILDIFKKRFLTILLEKTDFDKDYSNYTFQTHNQDVNVFREYDRKVLNLSAARIKCKLIENLPNNSGFNNTAHGGEMRLLQRELKKKSRLMSTRKLIENLPVLLPQLKPCMMMSPLTVSSYLGTNPNWKFDIVIFDEASQVKPEYAITSIVRGSQVIVAGDSKQMPPTSFFDSSDEEEYDEDSVQIENLESILDEMSSTFPDVYLNWHYRSKDETLIAFSNHHFYNNRLATFPSPNKEKNAIGVSFVYCDDGLWDNKNGNKNEAEKVALLIFEHIKLYPNQSLGVVAFGKSQQYAIEEALNKLRDLHPENESFFSDLNPEPFFVKNLENVQGDERDKIILSCGYGKDANGKFAMRFGPLAMTGGERRLNVAISRAKRSMIIVSSFKASEIRDAENNSQRKLIRDFIDYAEHGTVALIGADAGTNENLEFDSGFEEDVYNYLVNKGYKLCTQVGASGYKIDMAVKHPKITSRFILAIECDGAAYHSSRTARDRDILRQNILEKLGWKFYRIWSTNWFHDNLNEKKRLIDAIDNAIRNYDNVDDNLEKNQKQNTNTYEIQIEKRSNNCAEELENIYSSWNNSLKDKFGNGTCGYNGWSNNDGWNSLYVMENYDVIGKILEQILKYKGGFSPEDVFREINEVVFEKKRYTEQAKTIFESNFKQFIDNGKIEVVNNTIRLKQNN